MLTLSEEVDKITGFLQSVEQKTGIHTFVLAWSGGIDSTVSLYLLAKAIPKEHITILHLPYETSYEKDFIAIQNDLNLDPKQFHAFSIKPKVDVLWHPSQHQESVELTRVRKGNMMARVRMIILYDWAKKLNALVCGTENKTEDLLGYFTRFGDAASDIEPIRHLYKTQVSELAKYLKVPETFITRQPTAGLWDGQTDEGEFGFSYEEADEVLFRSFERSKSVEEIKNEGFPNAKKIIALANRNTFKHEVPYGL